MSRRGATLEFAVLGLLHDTDLHGYELRKRLAALLGAFRALSFGSLYPRLRSLVARGLIEERSDEANRGRRPRITYSLTAKGREALQDMVGQTGPQSWEDGDFDVHFAFFDLASSDVRLRILEGRRSRLEERVDQARQAARARRERADRYSAELHRHGLDATEREVRWLSELIESERSAYGDRDRTTSAGPTGTDKE